MKKNISIIISKKNKDSSNNNNNNNNYINIIKNQNIDYYIDINNNKNIKITNIFYNICCVVNYIIKYLIIKCKYLLILIIFIIFLKNT